jgi:hypothetical protein
MAAIKLPLSGDVTQTFNINVGESSDPAVERDALCIASYGKQLGRIGDALVVLLKHLPLSGLPPEDEKAILDLKCMLHEMANMKKAHGAKHILWPPLA